MPSLVLSATTGDTTTLTVSDNLFVTFLGGSQICSIKHLITTEPMSYGSNHALIKVKLFAHGHPRTFRDALPVVHCPE